MRPVDDKECYSIESAHDNHSTTSCNFKFRRGNGTDKASHCRKAFVPRTKPTPSKWDDAQKWLVGLSDGGDHSRAKNKPRNSNADDRRLLGPVTQNGRQSCSSMDGGLEDVVDPVNITQDEGETKKIAEECNESWRMNKPAEDELMIVRPVSVRDMGTEMTPTASKEPSRTATPLRATTPAIRSPISSTSSTPGRCCQGGQPIESYQTIMNNMERRRKAVILGKVSGNVRSTTKEINGSKILEDDGLEQIRNPNSLESQAVAWVEAEQAKYIARYKREEVNIQDWENRNTRKAETEMRRMEMKAERLKSRAQERLANKLATTQRVAEEKRANAEAKLHERAAKISERADYIRKTGHLPFSFFYFKLPSLCS